MAARASAAYESADAIRQSYPKTILVNSPGTMDVQYFVEQDNEANTQHVTIRGTANRENFLETSISPCTRPPALQSRGQWVSIAWPGGYWRT
jgi:hypothetical protein